MRGLKLIFLLLVFVSTVLAQKLEVKNLDERTTIFTTNNGATWGALYLGKEIVPNIYSKIELDSRGYLTLSREKNGKILYGVADLKGTLLLSVIYDRVRLGSSTILGVKGDDVVSVPIGENKKRIIAENEHVYTIVEQMPQYPGGDEEMISYVGRNLQYPPLAKEKDIQGRVIVRFIVDVDGAVINPEVQTGIDPSCDREAIRIINSMDKWTPGKQNGKTVKVYFTLPILFRLR